METSDTTLKKGPQKLQNRASLNYFGTTFIKNNRKYNPLNTAERIFIWTTPLSADWLKYEREITRYVHVSSLNQN